jgi:hypothetical protein
MGVSQSLFVTAIFTLGLSLVPSTAGAITLQYLSSASEMPTLLDNPAFVAEAQIGKIALSNFYESEAGNTQLKHKSLSLKAEDAENQIDFDWSNGKKQPFSLTYDGSMVRYTVGANTLESKITGWFKDLCIFLRASENGSSTLLDSLKLKDPLTALSISSLVATDKDGGLTAFYIHGIAGTFALTGNATLIWTDKPQSRDNVAYQIRVGTVESPKNVPEPSPVIGLTLGSVVLALWNQRR